MNPSPPRPRSLATLELALGVAVAGVLLTLALGALGRLQLLGREAQRVTQASNQAAASQAQALRCQLQAPPTPSIPSRSCP